MEIKPKCLGNWRQYKKGNGICGSCRHKEQCRKLVEKTGRLRE